MEIHIPSNLTLELYCNAEVLHDGFFFASSYLCNIRELTLGHLVVEISHGGHSPSGEVLCFSVVIWLNKVVRLLQWFFFSCF